MVAHQATTTEASHDLATRLRRLLRQYKRLEECEDMEFEVVTGEGPL